MRYQIVLSIVLLALLAILLFSLFYGSRGKAYWNGGMEGFSDMPELSDKEQELFEDLSNNKLSEDDIMKLVNAGVINDNLIMKFINQIDTDTSREKFKDNKDNKDNKDKEKFESTSSMSERKITGEEERQVSIDDLVAAAQGALVSVKNAEVLAQQAKSAATFASKKAYEAGKEEENAKLTIASVVEKAQQAKNEFSKASETAAIAIQKVNEVKNEKNKAENAVKKEEDNVDKVKKKYGNSKELDNAKKDYDKARDLRGRIYVQYADVVKQAEYATTKKNEAQIKGDTIGKEEEKANMAIASIIAAADAARNEEAQANRTVVMALRKVDLAREYLEKLVGEIRRRGGEFDVKSNTILPPLPLPPPLPAPVSAPLPIPVTAGSSFDPTESTLTVSQGTLKNEEQEKQQAEREIPIGIESPTSNTTVIDSNTMTSNLTVADNLPQKIDEPIVLSASVIPTTTASTATASTASTASIPPADAVLPSYNESVARVVVEPFCGTWNGIYASKL